MSDTRLLFLDSATNAQVIAGQSSSDDFTTTFSPSLILGGKSALERSTIDISPSYELALITLNTWNSIPNIDAVLYANNIFTYNAINITFPTGNYSFAQMQTIISNSLVANALLATDIQLIPDTSQNKIHILVAAGVTVDLSTSNWRLLAGFDLAQSPLIGPSDTYGNNPADITNGQDSYLVHCDAVVGSTLNGGSSDIILVYRPNARPGAAVTITPNVPIYTPCSRNDSFSRIRVYITDNLNRRITYNGEDVNMQLHIRKQKISTSPQEFQAATVAALRMQN